MRLLAVLMLVAASVQAADAPVLPLEVHADGSVLLDGHFIRYQHRIDANFQELAARAPKPTLHLTVTDNVTDQVLDTVLAAAAKVGLNVERPSGGPK